MLRYMTVVGALCAGCAPFLSGGVPRPEADAAVIGISVGVVLTAALALGGRWSSRVAAVLGTGLAAVVWWLLVSDLLTGLTGDDLPVLAVGASAVAVGAIGRASRGARIPLSPASTEEKQVSGRLGWRVRPGGVVAVVVVAVAAVVAPSAADAVIVRSETRDARDFPAEPVAERPAGRQWVWQPPADVVDVVPAGHGVAVASRDGSVVALNGVDGRVEWRYARPGAPVGKLLASMDRRTVLVSYRSLHDTRAQSVVALDADTGSPRFELVVRSVLVETGQLRPGTRMLTMRDGDTITGYDLVTGARQWAWSPPEGCTSRFGLPAWGRTTVLAPLECPESLGVLALDEVSGRERWRYEAPRDQRSDERQDVLLRATRDGAVVAVEMYGVRAEPGSVPNGLLDTETGRVLVRPERPWTVRTDVGVMPLLEHQENGGATEVHSLDPATGAITPLSVEACPARSADTTTSTTYLRACGDNGRELTVVTQSLDGSPPTATPVRLDGSGSRSDVHLVAAPGAIVLTRTAFGGTPSPVVGLVG
ncbi:outer membrane protein assembly factor BamB family protein [Saccharothrix sp. NRRL B-16314]|uniref:outer membrane protein assembly factor BamB family protein n=1 Tax=Saccharothrix sp. NRRL B-16314 TaxID=1463825 RepID=UPI0005273B6A|nr:PQQ-binding-like beta-propeller repeat protein [Saccharothrix sp. NRRL B-16314]